MRSALKKYLKIYGTRRRAHRERWVYDGKGVYREVRRDSQGKVVYTGKWSWKKPTSKIYGETEPLIIEYTTGREALQKVREAVREWEWLTRMEVES